MEVWGIAEVTSVFAIYSRQAIRRRMALVHRKKETAGFSLIELLVVTTIIIVLSAVGLVTFTTAGKNARDGKRKSDIEAVRQSLVLYRSDNASYPTTSDYSTIVANPLITEGYLSAPAPLDPKNDATYFYQYAATGGGTGFCVCARVESAGEGNSSNASCNFVAGSDYYCAKNP